MDINFTTLYLIQTQVVKKKEDLISEKKWSLTSILREWIIWCVYLHEVEHSSIVVEDVRESDLPFSQQVDLMFTQEITAEEIGHVPAKGNTNRGLSGQRYKNNFYCKNRNI